MRLILKVAQDDKSGKGVIEIIEDKGPMIKAMVGFLSYENEEQKKFYIDTLLKGGKFGEVENL
ncbi:MAG: hypothetical protein LUO84_05925 [Methanomassiliicoccales archaeon]|nr:hypothetical protein [Methanomassiliicoccales archaeon]